MKKKAGSYRHASALKLTFVSLSAVWLALIGTPAA